MRRKGGDAVAGRNVPKPDRPVGGPGGERFSIGRECHGQHITLMTINRTFVLARGEPPQLDLFLPQPGSQHGRIR